jgi:hypothetical protein
VSYVSISHTENLTDIRIYAKEVDSHIMCIIHCIFVFCFIVVYCEKPISQDVLWKRGEACVLHILTY